MDAKTLGHLEQQGVRVVAPETVHIDDNVNLAQIKGPNTVLHPGTRLSGDKLTILSGCEIGGETQATVDNCALGPQTTLKGGYFSGALFLRQSSMGSGSHVRAGTILEEEANGAHTVGLKQTVLLPFVTLGSLINFCDITMAGGTSRKDHSEVGSGYIHFNFTPFGKRGDKATASLIGDIPNGVMVRSKRIFLGGQGGLVGPLHVDYGSVLAAGFVYRHDYGSDQLVVGEALTPRSMPFSPLRYNRVRDKMLKNLTYIGNLVALRNWYQFVRLASGETEIQPLYQWGIQLLEGNIDERIKRLEQLAEAMPDSIDVLERSKKNGGPELADQKALAQHWPEMAQRLAESRNQPLNGSDSFQLFLEGLEKAKTQGQQYLEIIRALDDDAVTIGTRWLSDLVTAQVEPVMGYFPA
jgi:bifunctional UDP-N-acetylglucosamine pyrophosphorylase / glucosamine-1-phosphate N-acetyltransferase